ncbi:MAG: GNAT family N-acetyltransferase, partial [OM182 bacterium]
MTLTWHTKPFDALSNSELYSMLRLRSEVFVVEQDCVYL